MRARNVIVGADFGPTGDEAIRVGLQQLADIAAEGMYVMHVLAPDAVAARRAGPGRDTVQMVGSRAEDACQRASELGHAEGLGEDLASAHRCCQRSLVISHVARHDQHRQRGAERTELA